MELHEPITEEWLKAVGFRWDEWERSEVCNLQHITDNMVEKLEGYICRYCAKHYEARLLKQLTQESHETASR